jgi:hypothetical protein
MAVSVPQASDSDPISLATSSIGTHALKLTSASYTAENGLVTDVREGNKVAVNGARNVLLRTRHPRTNSAPGTTCVTIPIAVTAALMVAAINPPSDSNSIAALAGFYSSASPQMYRSLIGFQHLYNRPDRSMISILPKKASEVHHKEEAWNLSCLKMWTVWKFL